MGIDEPICLVDGADANETYFYHFDGFGFGFGIERLAMGKYEITDIRWLYKNDLRFPRLEPIFDAGISK